MTYVLEASVAVAALRRNEPGHADALRRCRAVFEGRDEIVVPAIFDIEVVSALVRRGACPTRIDLFFDRHFTSRTLVTIGPRAARMARTVASATKLRAADALYVRLAAREGVPWVTANRGVLERAGNLCTVTRP